MTAKPELLAPAGNMEALRAAVAGGADAVYFGAKSFSNRARAKNFDDDELKDAIKFAHSCGVKCHITVNTRVRDREMDEILRLADVILGGDKDSTADALIVADFGVAAQILHRYPHAVLHASTQTSMASVADCVELKKIGFSRIVLPRELSYAEIKLISQNSPIETEIFIHGAHCVSLSGQCLMSYVMGGRSGNRGECAQPCRLSYSMNKSHGCLLSLADMCLAGQMKKVCDTGTSSLKIEGRLKPPTYVYGVTKIYRRLLDEDRDATPDEVKALAEIFTRGFTSGYFDGKYYSMAAKDSAEKAENISETREFKSEIAAKVVERQNSAKEKFAVKARLKIEDNSPVKLTLSCTLKDEREVSTTVEGEPPLEATGKPTEKAMAYRSLSKLGDTIFYLNEDALYVETSGNTWIPTSALNDLRRRASAELEEKVLAELSSSKTNEKKENCEKNPIIERAINKTKIPLISNDNPEKAALIVDPELILNETPEKLKAVFSPFDRVYVQLASYERIAETKWKKSDISVELCAYLPAIMPSDKRLETLLESAIDAGCGRFKVHTIGQAETVRKVLSVNKTSPKIDIKIDFSYRTNITNSTAAEIYKTYSPEDIYYSPELPSSAVARQNGSTFAYGKLPLMTLSDCMFTRAEKVKCKNGNLGGRWKYEENSISNDNRRTEPKPHFCKGYLTDRKGEKFFAISDGDCVNYVFNSVPIWMGDRMKDLAGCKSLLYCFTDESADDIIRIMQKYAGNMQRTGRRI